MSGLRATKLGELLRVAHGYAFKGEHFASDGRHVVLTPGNFHENGGFRSRPGKDRYYRSTFPDRYILEKDALIVAMTEQGEGLLGSAALVPEGDCYLHNQRIGLVRAKDEVAETKFLYYLFNTSLVRQQIRNSSAGTKIRHTSPERIYQTNVLVPDFATQQKIAAILSAYDDLIANNQRRIALLERMAEDIYREWFVRLRFPGHEQVKIEKGVPQGWRAVQLAEICTFAKGKNPPELLNALIDGALPYLNVEALETSDISYTIPMTNSIVCSTDDVLMLMDGARSGHIFRGHAGVVSSTFALVRTEPKLKNIVFEYLKAGRDAIVFNNTGSAIPHANKDFINRMTMFLPFNDKLVAEFNAQYEYIFGQLRNLAQQNINLKATRDTLLPRLISGQLAVDGLDIQFPPGMAAAGARTPTPATVNAMLEARAMAAARTAASGAPPYGSARKNVRKIVGKNQ